MAFLFVLNIFLNVREKMKNFLLKTKLIFHKINIEQKMRKFAWEKEAVYFFLLKKPKICSNSCFHKI